MKGKITIEFNNLDDITVTVKTSRLHKLEKLILIDALVESLRLSDDEERIVAGLTIAVGGLKAVSGVPAERLEIDVNAIKEVLRKDKNNRPDTSPGEA